MPATLAERRAGVPLTRRQHDVLKLLVEGLSVRHIAERLALSISTVGEHRDELLKRLGVTTTAQLRLRAQLEITPVDVGPETVRTPTTNLLRRQSHLLPNISLSNDTALSARFRAAPHYLHTLREAVELVRFCNGSPGHKPDDLSEVLLHQCGTLGARQALIAALARECGRDDVVLTVGCTELDLLQFAVMAPSNCSNPVHTLPLAVCYLRYGGRRLQYSKGDRCSQLTSAPNSETRVDPYRLADQRRQLYRDFASDWCQAFNMDPCEFTRLRALCRRATHETALFEDLLGYGLEPEFQPNTR